MYKQKKIIIINENGIVYHAHFESTLKLDFYYFLENYQHIENLISISDNLIVFK